MPNDTPTLAIVALETGEIVAVAGDGA